MKMHRKTNINQYLIQISLCLHLKIKRVNIPLESNTQSDAKTEHVSQNISRKLLAIQRISQLK